MCGRAGASRVGKKKKIDARAEPPRGEGKPGKGADGEKEGKDRTGKGGKTGKSANGPKAPANVLVFGTSPLRVIPIPPISPLPVSNPRALDSSDSPALLSALRSFARVASSAPRAKSGSKTPRCASVVICKS